ncbi:hypothetical protein TWF192_008056 [Orbilia oligospora]|uniref:Uncharacterized protein n=1 Tax=Orbilia oligospora TaxID=2813651 RepID=A0A6G1MLH5_ORBOL|nr:hypothetical protein TWF191_004300 [Orbilia oligospora]KAF3261590.1 hypothetical protein TWF192_008056 [Orbilia oligospora]
MRTPTPTLEHFLGLDKEGPVVWGSPNEFQDYNIFPDPELQNAGARHHLNLGLGSPARIEQQGLEQQPLIQEHSLPCQSRSKRGKVDYNCPTTDCGQKFSDRKSLGRHRNQVHEEKEYNCIGCGSGFSRQDGLRKHHFDCKKAKEILLLQGSAGIVKRVKRVPGDPPGQIGTSEMVPTRRSSRHSSRSSASGATIVTPPFTANYHRKRARDHQPGEDNWRAKCHKAEREKEENERAWMEKYHELEIQYANGKAAWMNERHELEERLAKAEGTH